MHGRILERPQLSRGECWVFELRKWFGRRARRQIEMCVLHASRQRASTQEYSHSRKYQCQTLLILCSRLGLLLPLARLGKYDSGHYWDHDSRRRCLLVETVAELEVATWEGSLELNQHVDAQLQM